MTLHYFIDGKHETVHSDNFRAVHSVDTKTGQVLTNYGPAPWSELYGKKFYVSEETLLASLDYSI